MRTLRRALPALLLGAMLVAPVSPAAADWSCSFYRWDEPAEEWVLVARLYPREKFKETHVYLVDWHCEYCYVPFLEARNPDDVFEDLDDAQALTQEQTQRIVRHLESAVPSPGSGEPIQVDPWNYPPCPPVPPLWDDEALDTVGGGIG